MPDFRKLVPPGFLGYEDLLNQRWQLATDWRGFSRSWTIRSKDEAAKVVLKDAWAEWTNVTGHPCTVTGLMD